MIQIYMATHRESGKAYVGQAKDMDARRKTHSANPPRNLTSGLHIHDALKKWGKDAFDWRHVASARNRAEARVVEAFIIQQERTYVPLGFNMHVGYKTLIEAGVPEQFRLSEKEWAAIRLSRVIR